MKLCQWDDRRTCVVCGYVARAVPLVRTCRPPPQNRSKPKTGPGTELKALLRDWLGIVASPGCSCNAMAARMDRMGPDWCEGPGMPEILGVMRAEHAKRRAAGTTILPWSDTAARQLVLLACRRARASA